MRFKRTLSTALLIVAIGLLWSLQAGAYGLFAGDNNCNQCHTTWPGAEHTFHTNFYECSVCHTVEPIPSSTCAGCHDVPDMFVQHGPLIDQSGYQCGYCHEGVDTEPCTLTDLKNLFE